MRWPRLSIRATLALAIAGAVLLPTAVLWQADQQLTRATHEPLIAQGRQAALITAAATLAGPLWLIDDGLTRAAAQKVLDDPTVLRLSLVETRPNTPALQLARPGEQSATGPRLKAEVRREDVVLGELTLEFDPAQIDRVLAQRGTTALQLAGLQILLSLALLLPVMARRLLRPIARLKSQASAMAGSTAVVPTYWDRRDELGELGHHLNEVRGQIATLFEQAEVQQAELLKIARHDALTGLPNRRLFAELTQSAVASAQRDGSRLALLFIDIDRFKSINDNHGHAIGDKVLQELASRLRATVRQGDVVCRHSGDEFTVLLRGFKQWDEVAGLADRLLKEAEAPVQTTLREVVASVSIGIALYPDDALTHEALVGHADTAMYAAKSLGRARYSFYRADLNSQLLAQAEMEQALVQGLRQGEFLLHYQPLLRAVDGELVGCEALLRWQHPQRGLVSPAEFIPAAEQFGLISELGAFAVRSACQQIARWKACGVRFGTVAVNVSALEFRHHRLIDNLVQSMTDYGVQPHELEIELTESVLMTDTDNTQRIIGRLQDLGLAMSVDDFGTGYSSLAYLKRLRPSKIKIDRSFVRDLPGDADDRVLVPAIVQLAHSIGITVVGEGVETEAQRQFLQACGCDILQGYLLSRPQTADGFERFVEAAQAAQALPA